MKATRWEEACNSLWSLYEDDPLAPGYDKTVCSVEVEAGKMPGVSGMTRPLTPAETAALAHILGRLKDPGCQSEPGCQSGTPPYCEVCRAHGGCPAVAAQRLLAPRPEAERVSGASGARKCQTCNRYFDKAECPYCAEIRRRERS